MHLTGSNCNVIIRTQKQQILQSLEAGNTLIISKIITLVRRDKKLFGLDERKVGIELRVAIWCYK